MERNKQAVLAAILAPGSPPGSGGDADAICAQAGIDHVASKLK